MKADVGAIDQELSTDSVRHERCGEQAGDDGSEDQRVRETREHRNSTILGDWHCDSSSRRRTDEDACRHELAQVGNIPGHQDRSDKRQASSECSDGKIGRRNGRGCLHERTQGASKGSGKKQDSEVMCWCCKHPNVASNRGTTTRDSRKARGQATAKEGARESSSATVTSAAS